MPRKAKYIYKRKDGRWEVRFPVGRTNDHKIKHLSIYRNTYREAKEVLAQFFNDQAFTSQQSEIRLFSDVLDSWIAVNANQQKAATKLKYAYMIEKHIRPELGAYDIAELSETVISQFLQNKLSFGRLDDKGGLSRTYVKLMKLIIQSTMDYGAELGYCKKIRIRFSNPQRTKAIPVLSNDSRINLEKNLVNDQSLEGLGILIALNTGMRIGELCALRWDDIDLQDRIIHVRHTISRVPNADCSLKQKTVLIIDSPKTESSLRDIPISSKLYSDFKKYASITNLMG